MFLRSTKAGQCFRIGIVVLVCAPEVFCEPNTIAERIFERFRERHVVADDVGFAGAFSQTYDSPLTPGESITQRFEWKRQDDAWAYDLEMLQSDGIHYRTTSWDGQMSVERTYNDGDIGRRPQEDEYYLNDETFDSSSAPSIEQLIDIIDEDAGGRALHALNFDDSENVLTVGTGGVPSERIYFTDLDKLIYSHIEYVDPTGRVLSTKIVDSWAEHGGANFPKTGEVWNNVDGKRMFTFEIDSVEMKPVFAPDDFVVELPNVEGVTVMDYRFDRGFYVSDLDPALLEEHKYLEATEKKFAESLSEVAQKKSLENVELSLFPTESDISTETVEGSISGTEKKVRIENLKKTEEAASAQRSTAGFVFAVIGVGVVVALLFGRFLYARRGAENVS